MAGSAVTGGLSMAFGCTSRAPHGGIWVVGLIGKPFLWILSIAAGVLVSAIVVVVAKSFKPGESDEQIAAEIEAGAAAELPAPRTATPARTAEVPFSRGPARAGRGPDPDRLTLERKDR